MSKFLRSLLFVVILVTLFADARTNGKRRKKNDNARDRQNLQRYKVLYEQAKVSEACRGLEVDELVNQCASFHMSPDCFVKAFGDRGLEFGEEDTSKDKDFTTCLKETGVLHQ